MGQRQLAHVLFRAVMAHLDAGRLHALPWRGFDAQDVGKAFGFKVMLREQFARVKVFLDLYMLGTRPKFLGEKIEVK